MAYTTTATTKGGRDGRAVLEGDKLALAMALPKHLGGNGEGHNPEQLFALGWSSCFGQAVLLAGAQQFSQLHGERPLVLELFRERTVQRLRSRQAEGRGPGTPIVS